MRRPRWLTLLMVLTTVVVGSFAPTMAASAGPVCPGSAWSADYFPNRTLTGPASLSRCDAAINFNWGATSPGAGVPADGFSARWSRTVAFTAGTWNLTASADDGIRVSLDGAVVLDGWKDQGTTTYRAAVAVTAGNHLLTVEYYDNTYDATAVFSFAAAGNLVGNGDLAAGPNFPGCFFDGSWGTSRRQGALSADVPAGVSGRSYSLTVADHASGDAKIMQSADPGCAATVTATGNYTVGLFYRSTVAANAVVVFTQDAAGGWTFWQTLATLPAAAAWTQQTYTLTGLPAGTTRVSFGVAALGNGTLSTAGYSLTAAPATQAGLDVTGRWSVSAVTLPGRAIHTTLLRDGRLLLIAGSGNDANNFAAGSFTTSVWNPATGVTTPVPTPEDMFCSGHVTLPDGRVLIQGGTKDFPGVDGAETFTGLRSSYIFDPATNAFTRTNDAQDGHWYPTLTKLGNGDVWMAGGLGETFNSVSVKTEIFRTAEQRWLAYGEMTQSWQYWGEYPHMFLMADGRLFYTGGHTFGDQRSGTGASIYDIATGTVGDVPGLTDKDLRDHAGSVLLPPAQDQRFLIAGGGHIDVGAAPTNSAAVIDLDVAAPAFRAAPAMPGPGRQYVNLTTLFDRTVLASNGATGNRTGDIAAAAIYRPAANTWTTNTPADPVGRNYHSTAVLMPDGRVMVMGSNPIDGSFESRISVYEPPYLFKGTRPTLTAAPSFATYGSTVSVGVTGTAVSASLTSPGSVTHQMDSNARLVDLPMTGTGATRTLTVPANPDLLPPGPYMLTVLDASGVPSVARWITIRPGAVTRDLAAGIDTPATRFTGWDGATAALTSLTNVWSAVPGSTPSGRSDLPAHGHAGHPTAATPSAAAASATSAPSGRASDKALEIAVRRPYLVPITPTADQVQIASGVHEQATQVPMAKVTPEQGAAAAAEAVTESARTGGCVVGYGDDGSCLPQVSPSSARMGGMAMDWTCDEVRAILPDGIALSTPGVDPQRLDANQDGTACGRGD
ncbi:galactose oxidase-like domain-containing protein [Nakamurella deserti]|uniref:galactose oxidase-like domain-containing protein n=1 Tax=Nakamurella deserti TaxID=2164074 RepID=UPI000DBE63F5|nr:galactose oxidase-like domain-containing protein [Nakamurella deserti]